MLSIALVWAIDLSFRKYVLKDIIDMAVNYHSNNVTMRHLIWPTLIYVSMAILVTTAFRFYGYFVDIKMVPLLRQKIADWAFNVLLQQSHSYFLNNFAGDLTHKTNNLIDSTVELIKLVIDRFVGYFFALIFALFTLSLVNIKFAIVTLVWVVIFIVASILNFQKLSKLAKVHSKCSTRVTANIADSLTNITSIRLFTQKNYKRVQFFQIYKQKILAEKNIQWAYFWLWFIYGYSFDFLQAISLYFLIYGYQSGTIVLGDIVLVLGINAAIVEFLNQLTKDLEQFSAHYGKVLDALSAIDVPVQVTDRQNAAELNVRAGQIKLNHIGFNYPKKEPLFRDLSITIGAKEKVGLVGYSGAGKSTFINLILRLFEVHGGDIKIDNQSIANVTQNSLRKNIAVVSQELLLFHDTILENIHCGNRDAISEDIIQASKFAGIHDFITHSPEGYNSIVGDKGLKLSGGERQRIMIARAFLKNAPILLLDEATNQLDAITEQDIQRSLFKLMNNKTTIVIAHRLSTLLHMDRILVLDAGKIVQDGSHSELVSMKGLYQNLWNVQTDDLLRY